MSCRFPAAETIPTAISFPAAECNSLKGETAAEDFLRSLYRLRCITSADLEGRLRALETLAAGELRPILAAPAVVFRKPRNP